MTENHPCPTCDRTDFASEQGMKVHHKREHGYSIVERTECEHCGVSFKITDYSKPNRFCSIGCLSEHNTEYRDCEKCGREISGRRTYCCPACEREDRLKRPRPDNTEMLLWLLYHYEGFNLNETYQRQRAVLGAENCLSSNSVKDRLTDMGVYQSYSHHNALVDMSPEDVGLSSSPDGDEGYKEFYPKGQQAD